MTPHSHAQLQMNTPSGTWRDIQLYLWHSDHDLAPDEPTLALFFERRGEDGYVYTAVTPRSVRTLSMNAFYAYVKDCREEVDVSAELKQELHEAWEEGLEALRQALIELQETTAVAPEVVNHE